MKNDKLQKLQNHERSARQIGSIAEADAFKAKIDEILEKNKGIKSIIDCVIKCSCGMEMDITIQAGNLSQMIFNNLVKPHYQKNHTVEIIER